MIDIVGKNMCTGCGACNNICPKNSISMLEDEEGFLYPNINKNSCIKCNMCEKVCPVLNRIDETNNYKKPYVYAAWSLDEKVRFNSTSGGIFTELAKGILSDNGYVVGARYNKKNIVEHYIIDKIKHIAILRQSKYIQSNIGLIFKDVRDLLDRGNKVLFVGSPCEVSGLLNFLRRKYENLIVVDFVCRGTNSPKVYRKYLNSLENKYKSKVKKVWFKNKTYGWNRFSTKIIFENGKHYIKDRYNDSFMRGYIEHNLYMRRCCENCMYKSLPRISDITLADFWGIGNSSPKLDEDKGTSLVIINSDKGKKLFEDIGDSIFSKKSSMEVALKGNHCILNSIKANPRRTEFFEEIDNTPFEKLIKRYCGSVIISNIKRKTNVLISRMKIFK